jgi:hypothetical protein
LGIVKDNAGGIATPRKDAADAVPEIHAIEAARPVHGTIVNGEYDGVALSKRDHDGPGLHSRPLLRHHEFATLEFFAGLRQQECHLKGKYMLAV